MIYIKNEITGIMKRLFLFLSVRFVDFLRHSRILLEKLYYKQ